MKNVYVNVKYFGDYYV
ncbi:Protein of unknown function [Bacillus cereus]|nr:Protein of unknown function [Bacillus mycoides]SCC66306.1 Protein of unknown function [Bacillus cereus]SCN01072.1 Protein of unknown function [Bacillus cereus]SCN40254.1 Protein of unknown function [Bacillus wiedmannii]